MCSQRSYSRKQIETMLSNPAEISGNPYMLHAAYAMSCLYDLLAPETDENEEDMPRSFIFGQKAPKRLIDGLAADIASDFNDAADNYKPIRVFGKQIPIKRSGSYCKERLHDIFSFEQEGGEYVISEDGIVNLDDTDSDEDAYKSAVSESERDRLYLKKVVMLAENDADNGWDKLTDMEVVMYCWAKFRNDRNTDNFMLFEDEYKEYIYVSKQDIIDCFTDKAKLRENPVGMYTFSAKRVMEWNKKHKQKSLAEQINDNSAKDYWYEVALKTSFKCVL